ncbi:DUF6185 family protein [Streptomyces noursei]|uniref:DUF6185 family protein n=2 Tax=Streptomyces noursei TaxID=1971 RepID=UPI0027E43F3A|nr:DUF6185 family protein [Streptomyces noursei]
MTPPGWRWVLLVVATLGWWAAQPMQVHAAGSCPPIRHPEKVTVSSTLSFSQRHPDLVEARQVTNLAVPKQQWTLADDLTLGAQTAEYRRAMHCLLHGDSRTRTRFDTWNPEWRLSAPQATKRDDLIVVHYESWNLIKNPGFFEVGPWAVHVVPGKDWASSLRSPELLKGASWKEVEVDPGSLKISEAPPASKVNANGGRVWIAHAPVIAANVVPPKALGLALSRYAAWFAPLGVVSWWICASAVIAVSAWPFLDARKATGSPERAAARVLATTVLQWAGLSAALGLTLLLILQQSRSLNPVRAVVGLLSGLALVLLARPWLPFKRDFDGGRRVLKRRARLITAAATTVAVVGLLVVWDPHLIGLPSNLMPTVAPPASGIAGLVLLDLAILWLLFAAMVAWSWRFVREGQLGDFSTGRAPVHSVRRLTTTGAALALAAAMVVSFRWYSFQRRWHRTDWLGEASTVFGAGYRSVLGQQLAEFASAGAQWAYAYTWVLAGVALVALLHLSHRASSGVSLAPQQWDLLLVTAIFAIVVALRGGVLFAGSLSLAYGLWLPLNMVVLYALVKAGRRRSLLGRVDRKAGGNCVAVELSTVSGHRRLLDDAHRCRALLRQLRVAYQGDADEATRRNLEKQLRSLHRWRPAGCRHDCLPDAVSVVDVALSWGPHRHWWHNALHAARWAVVFGILPSAVTDWYGNAAGTEHWRFTLNSPTGIPDVMANFLMQEISYAGAGLVLGALWRVLPGERGPLRAFNLFLAWLVPIGVVAALSLSIGSREVGWQVLSVVLMLMVLTLTSMWMDADTFSGERRYWTKRLDLLTSIYQVHGLSRQIAFLVAQLVTAVTIWRTVVTSSK